MFELKELIKRGWWNGVHVRAELRGTLVSAIAKRYVGKCNSYSYSIYVKWLERTARTPTSFHHPRLKKAFKMNCTQLLCIKKDFVHRIIWTCYHQKLLYQGVLHFCTLCYLFHFLCNLNLDPLEPRELCYSASLRKTVW